MLIGEQIFFLAVISLAVASVSWTFTQEEIFKPVQEFCENRKNNGKTVIERKFFYALTCEYCFSHWVTLGFLILTGFHILFDDLRGYLIAFLILPWLANVWMSFYRRMKVEIKHENALAEKIVAKKTESKKD